MKIYLAGIEHGLATYLEDVEISPDEKYLGSFYYFKKRYFRFINNNDFLLDSGAFTFMNGAKGLIDWDGYIERYAEFIKEHNIKLFFELDIDVIVGIKEVERLRDKLEKLTERKCIPVWHKSRGLKYWKRLIKEYDYIAIGGLVTREIKKSQYGIFSYLLKEASKNGCNVHGLGFTNLQGIKKYKFYSVDSTSWISGSRFGHVYKFKDGKMIKINKKAGMRIKPREVAVNNFKKWVKFSKWAENKL